MVFDLKSGFSSIYLDLVDGCFSAFLLISFGISPEMKVHLLHFLLQMVGKSDGQLALNVVILAVIEKVGPVMGG